MNIKEFKAEHKIFGVTGHRPVPVMKKMKKAAKKAVKFALLNEYDTCSNGLAHGWDELIALECMENDIALILRLPYNIKTVWSAEIRRYALKTGFITWEQENYHPAYSAWNIYAKRNLKIVDDSMEILTYYDGRQTGGTLMTINMALNKDIVVHNFCEGMKLLVTTNNIQRTRPRLF